MRRKTALAIGVVLIVGLGVGAYAYRAMIPSMGTSCSKPSGGFLIISSDRGFNDSEDHGVPQSNWPVITVREGELVSIMVCNTDTQSHGFQIQHYLNSTTIVVTPRQNQSFSFVAGVSGTFRIYSGIFETTHAFVQSGELIVSP